MKKGVFVMFLLLFSLVCAQVFAQTAERERLDSLWIQTLAEPLVIYGTQAGKIKETDPGVDELAFCVSSLDSLRQVAADCMEAYRYPEAEVALHAAYSYCTDETDREDISTALRYCRSARETAARVAQLTVLDRHGFSVDDFFLYYPFPDGSWREVENAPAIYHPGDEAEIFISREASVRQIYSIVEGNRMYFSSKSIPGLGGYDIFYSDWNERLGEWGEPVNMGIPFNSSADDMLFMNTPDGKYSIFSSNRFSSPDSVFIYVVERSADLTYVQVDDADELLRISALEPFADPKRVDINIAAGESLQAGEKTLGYSDKAAEVRNLREKLSKCGEGELETARLKEQLAAAEKELEEIEKDFLSNGTGAESGTVEVEREVVVTDGVYTFTRKNLGPKIKVVYIED